MGNNQGKPRYSFFGLIFGQASQYKYYTKDVTKQLIEEINKSTYLIDKKYLITGASSGIGKDICKVLLQKGAKLIMVSRKIDNLINAQDSIIEELQKEKKEEMSIDELKKNIRLMTLDLSDLEQVDEFIGKIKDENIKLDGIINNGGVLPVDQKLMKYKQWTLEETILVHLISPFKLSIELLCQLNPNSQIINNTSAGLYTQKLDMELIQKNFSQCLVKGESKYQDGGLVYAQCKRAQLEMTDLFCDNHRELLEKQKIKVYSVHPGWAATPGLEPLFQQHPSYKKVQFRSSLHAAYGIVYAMINQQTYNKGFYFDGEIQCKHRCLAGTSVDQNLQAQLWNYLHQFLKQS